MLPIVILSDKNLKLINLDSILECKLYNFATSKRFI